MTARLPSELPRLSGRTLWLAFAAIVATFMVASALAIYWTSASQAKTRETMERMLTSVELVSKLAADVDHKRILVDKHIFTHEAAAMDRLEEQIARVDVDFAATARAYAPYAIGNGEQVVWQDLQSQAAAIDEPMRRAIAVSRQNRDQEARDMLRDVDSDFDAIARDATTLVRINRAEAADAMTTIRNLQRSSLLFTGGVTLIGIALSVTLATAIARVIRRREQDLRESSVALEQRNRELDAFAGRVAHDLRGPLTTINLAASRLSERAPQEEGTSAVLRRGVNRMEILIRDLLTLSRIDIDADGSGSDPAAVGAGVAEELGPRVAAEGGTLRMAVKPARVRCSEGLLRQVLWNLVDNALKYRRPDVRPDIEVRGQPAGGTTYELRVSDRGMGMSPDDARHAFDPFYRSVQTRETPGTGLGLSIVKRVVEAHEGKVSVDTRIGEGTTFHICLPLESRQPRSEPRHAEGPGPAEPRARAAPPLAARVRAWLRPRRA